MISLSGVFSLGFSGLSGFSLGFSGSRGFSLGSGGFVTLGKSGKTLTNLSKARLKALPQEK